MLLVTCQSIEHESMLELTSDPSDRQATCRHSIDPLGRKPSSSSPVESARRSSSPELSKELSAVGSVIGVSDH